MRPQLFQLFLEIQEGSEMEQNFATQTAQQPRIVFLHSEVRSYRVPIFERLHQNYPVKFLFLSGGNWAASFPEAKRWDYTYFRPIRVPGYSSDVTPGLIIKLWKERKRYDIILSSGLTTFATHVSFLMAKLLRKRFVVWAEDWMWSKHVLYRIASPYARFIVRHADACIVAGTKAWEFHLALGANPEKVFIAPNCAEDLRLLPFDEQQIEALRERINPHGKKIISYLGRVVAYKNLDALLTAFAKLEKVRDDVLLLVAGDGPFAPYCRSLIEKLRITNIVWQEGKRNPGTGVVEPVDREVLIRYLHLTDLFVLPGRFRMEDHVPSESWGLILNEAMSLGKPVLSTRSVAAAYDLINGKNGLQVREDDPHALYHGITRMLEGDLQEMGRESWRILQQGFTYDIMMEGFQCAISSLPKQKE